MPASHRSHVVRAGGVALAALLLLGLVMSPARAAGDIVFDGSPGTAAPPSTLGPYTMIPFPEDTRSSSHCVTTVPGPTGDLSFDHDLVHWRVGDGFATWSHGYTGDVYCSYGTTTVTMSLPAGTVAFYFYAMPNPCSAYQITATAQDGTTSGPVDVDADPDSGAGATYFGFYSTGAPMTTITVSTSVEFAVGEFGIYVGEAVPQVPESCTRADVAAVIYGGWDGIPIKAYVGGSEQETLYTAHDAFGRAAVLWTFYPPAGASWQVSVAPQVPAGLDPARWQYRLLGVETNRSRLDDAAGATVSVSRCSEHVLHFQLVDTGAE